MVKRISKLLGFILFFIISVMYLSPKENMYYFLEKELKPYGVVVSKENIEDRAYYLNINNLNVSYKEIESMLIDNSDFYIFVLYNQVSLTNIKIEKALSVFIPVNIESVNLYYSIFNPLNVIASAKGEFGELDASFNITENRLHLDLFPSKLMLKSYKNTLRKLKKTENGEYTYDKSF